MAKLQITCKKKEKRTHPNPQTFLLSLCSERIWSRKKMHGRDEKKKSTLLVKMQSAPAVEYLEFRKGTYPPACIQMAFSGLMASAGSNAKETSSLEIKSGRGKKKQRESIRVPQNK